MGVSALVKLTQELEALTARVAALESKPAAANVAGIARGAVAKWLPFVKYGGKACAGACGATITQGEQGGKPAWFERDAKGSRVYCNACGVPREKAAA